MSSSSYLLEDYGILSCSGKDALNFLQGQVTQDVREVASDTILFSAYCNAKGRVLASFYLYQFKEAQYFFIAPKNIIPSLLAELKKFAIFSKVLLEDVSQAFQLIGSEEIQPNGLLLPGVGPQRYLSIIEHSIDNLEKPKTINWTYLDILNGLAFISPETQEQFTPHDLSYEKIPAVSFKKGCYRGQEIIARMHYLGKPKFRLFRCELQKAAALGSYLKTKEQSHVGRLIYYTKNPNGDYLALASINPQLLTDKDFIYCNSEENQVTKIQEAIP